MRYFVNVSSKFVQKIILGNLSNILLIRKALNGTMTLIKIWIIKCCSHTDRFPYSLNHITSAPNTAYILPNSFQLCCSSLPTSTYICTYIYATTHLRLYGKCLIIDKFPQLKHTNERLARVVGVADK